MITRYYIEAFDAEGREVLGSLDGQAALGTVRQPRRCAAWRRIFSGRRMAYWLPTVVRWRLVDHYGKILAEYPPHWGGD